MVVTVKIHDVLHESGDWHKSPDELAEYIEWYTHNDAITNVRIAKGWANSPIYVTFDTTAITMQSIRVACRGVVRAFSHEVGGVDVDRTIRDRNLKIVE